MNIEKYITSKTELAEQIRKLVVEQFGLSDSYSSLIKTIILDKHFEPLQKFKNYTNNLKGF